ncbi:MAG: hypothetical protein RBS78_04380, partial [Coriobacteriia bacterium]|jgi:hypothetical protein|nr:hypothetical protein [Coriobacteriia bacterium]
VVPLSATVAAARLAEVLSLHDVAFLPGDEAAEDIAVRAVNLALATDGKTSVRLADEGTRVAAGLVFELRATAHSEDSGVPTVDFDVALSTVELAGRLAVAIEAASGTDDARVVVMLPQTPPEERDRQRIAVKLLDAVCGALD